MTCVWACCVWLGGGGGVALGWFEAAGFSSTAPLASSSFFGFEVLTLAELPDPAELPNALPDPFPRVNLKPNKPTTMTTTTTPIMMNRRSFEPDEGEEDDVDVGAEVEVGLEEADVLGLGEVDDALKESDRYETALEPLSTTNIAPLAES